MRFRIMHEHDGPAYDDERWAVVDLGRENDRGTIYYVAECRSKSMAERVAAALEAHPNDPPPPLPFEEPF